MTKSDVIGNVQSWRQNLKFKTLPQNLRSFVQPCDANENADENATAISHALCSMLMSEPTAKKKLCKEDMYVCPLNRDIYIYIYAVIQRGHKHSKKRTRI